MKKHLLFLLTFGLLPAVQPATAQSIMQSIRQFGIKAGLHSATQSAPFYDLAVDLGGNKDPRIGFSVGAFAEIGLRSPFSLQPELLYVQKGATIDGEGTPVQTRVLKTNYLEVPILGKATFAAGTARPFVLAGPAVGLLMSAKGRVEDEQFDAKEELKTLDLSLIAGGGVAFSAFAAEIRYTYGVANVSTSNDPRVGSVSNRALSLLLSYTIGPR